MLIYVQEEKHWPELFVRVYMDDAIGKLLVYCSFSH